MPSDFHFRPRSRDLRRLQTDAERKLWSYLRSRRLLGAKFRRQFPIDNFIVDFCCLEYGLIIEVDGGQHTDRQEDDKNRTEALVRLGYRVLRFWNRDVLARTDLVLNEIGRHLLR